MLAKLACYLLGIFFNICIISTFHLHLVALSRVYEFSLISCTDFTCTFHRNAIDHSMIIYSEFV